MQMLLPPLYPITDRSLAALTHWELVEALLAGGAGWIQIREKQMHLSQLQVEIVRAAEAAANRATLVINDWVELASLPGIAGVHLGQGDLTVSEARRQLPARIIGLSTHSLEQAEQADRLPVDYIAIGPVFPTRTKSENPPLGMKIVGQVRRVVSKPLVAIGGVTLENAAEVWEAGADSVAVISDIMKHPDIAGRTADYFRLWNHLHA
ncbi:MAG: thiamine phosphate synthase [Acidobacteria bacterium]|nr:thiamine phosphate synthase [Acidobacteriota bacterium]